MTFFWLRTLTPSPAETSATDTFSKPLLVAIIIVGAAILTRVTH
ncbi:MAG: hypothetical protein RLZZ269_154, partial [Actinomycetota bacterium]